jgi:hypothetical protein
VGGEHVVPTLGGAGLGPRDQLEIGAVLEDDQRVVRGAAGMPAAHLHGEAERAVILHRAREVMDRDDDMVEAEPHPPLTLPP